MTTLNIDFEKSPTVGRAIQSRSVVTGLVGPVGSGKSVGCCAWIMQNAMQQKPAADGIRYSRWAVIRNTAPELKSTTIKTFTDQFPEGPHGSVVFTSPITYHIRFPAKKGVEGISCEILFIALDTPRDVRKLLSLELTGAWVNEAREVPKPIIDMLTTRIGRYPAGRHGVASKISIILDTNPPDEYSWWYQSFEGSQPQIQFELPDGSMADLSWNVYHQPPAVLELQEIDEGDFTPKPGHNGEFKAYCDLHYRPGEVLTAADTYWGVNPEAENLSNVPAIYYPNLVINKSKDFIEVYAQGLYGYVQEGRAVVPEFSPAHIDDFPPIADRPLIIGIDIGGGTLQPAAAILQRHIVGTWLVQGELVGSDMGVDRFADVLVQYLGETFKGLPIEVVYTDPAAEVRDEIFEVKVNDHLRSKGFKVMPAPTQDWKARRLAIAQPCNRFINGRPGLLVHRTRARMISDGLRGKWNFKKLQLVGVDQFSETPMKNEYSHPCEALGYGLSGGGEHRVERSHPTTTAGKAWREGWATQEDWRVFDA